MNVDIGATVRSSDGKDVGKVDQLILDPASHEVKAAVVRKGVFLGRDVEVPLDAMAPDHDGALRLTYTADQVDNLPSFYEHNYTTTAPAGFIPWAGYPAGAFYWPLSYGAGVPASTTGNSDVDREVAAALRRWDLENAVVGEGSDVIDREGQKVGTVHDLTFDPESGRLTQLVVQKGFIFHTDVTLPASLVARADGGALYLKVAADEITA
jgi:uncharacterized protein YrrD